MKKLELRQLIREEVKKTLKKAQTLKYKAKHADNNLVAAIYFSWNKAEEYNKPSLWAKVIELIERQDCELVDYVVTDSVCELEFKPNSPAIDQDVLDKTRNNVELALEPLSSQWTGYDVYIVGN